jgi:hypothetical protein
MLTIFAGISYPVLWKKHRGIVNLQCSVHVSSPKRLCQGSALDGFPDTAHCFPLIQHRFSLSLLLIFLIIIQKTHTPTMNKGERLPVHEKESRSTDASQSLFGAFCFGLFWGGRTADSFWEFLGSGFTVPLLESLV